MQLYRPIYGGLPACRGLPDEVVELLTRSVYRRKPSLGVFPVVSVILSFSGIWMVGWLSALTGVSTLWAFLIFVVAFVVPVMIYDACVHRPSVNKEMERILAEPCASPNGGPAEPLGNSGAKSGPPSVS